MSAQISTTNEITFDTLYKERQGSNAECGRYAVNHLLQCNFLIHDLMIPLCSDNNNLLNGVLNKVGSLDAGAENEIKNPMCASIKGDNLEINAIELILKIYDYEVRGLGVGNNINEDKFMRYVNKRMFMGIIVNTGGHYVAVIKFHNFVDSGTKYKYVLIDSLSTSNKMFFVDDNTLFSYLQKTNARNGIYVYGTSRSGQLTKRYNQALLLPLVNITVPPSPTYQGLIANQPATNNYINTEHIRDLFTTTNFKTINEAFEIFLLIFPTDIDEEPSDLNFKDTKNEIFVQNATFQDHNALNGELKIGTDDEAKTTYFLDKVNDLAEDYDMESKSNSNNFTVNEYFELKARFGNLENFLDRVQMPNSTIPLSKFGPYIKFIEMLKSQTVDTVITALQGNSIITIFDLVTNSNLNRNIQVQPSAASQGQTSNAQSNAQSNAATAQSNAQSNDQSNAQSNAATAQSTAQSNDQLNAQSNAATAQSTAVGTSANTPVGTSANTQIVNMSSSANVETQDPIGFFIETLNGPITNGPITNGPITNEPITNEPITNEPITNGPITNEPITTLSEGEEQEEEISIRFQKIRTTPKT